MPHPKQHATRILVLMEAYVKKQASIRIMTAFVLILDSKEGSVMWTCVLNVIRTLDASTENAFAAKVTKEMAFPARKKRLVPSIQLLPPIILASAILVIT